MVSTSHSCHQNLGQSYFYTLTCIVTFNHWCFFFLLAGITKQHVSLLLWTFSLLFSPIPGNCLVLCYCLKWYCNTMYLDEMYRTWSASRHDLLRETTQEHLQLACTVSWLKVSSECRSTSEEKVKPFLKILLTKIGTLSKQSETTSPNSVQHNYQWCAFENIGICACKWAIVWQKIWLRSDFQTMRLWEIVAWTCVGECHVSYGTYSIDANVTFKPDHMLGCLGL